MIPDMIMIEYIILFVMLVYIGILHYRLMKKKLFIESIVEKLSKIENNWNRNEVVKFLKRLEKTNADFLVKEDKIMEESVLNFLFEDGNQLRSFVHYTAQKSVADQILEEGFKFSGSFHKTAEPLVPNDKVTLAYKHNLSKYFGKYILVMGISAKLYDETDKLLREKKLANYSVEQVLTEVSPTMDDNLDEIYLLPFQFVKGYVNYETGQIKLNKNYDPNFSSPLFIKNIEKFAAY